jgi:long-chain acyl-CoA synthetase
MKTFVSGGAPLDSAVEIDFKTMGFTLLQGYGLTETSPVAALNLAKSGKYGSVGKPLEGVEIQILKSSETPSREGEIIIRGPNVMKGYYNNPQKTAEMIKNGWFHTGDIGWVDEDGFLYISGRIKNLIVLGAGKKVFPEEVEQVMRQSPYIKEICVLGRITTEGARKGYEEVYAVIVPNLEHFEEKDRIDDKAVKEKISLEINRLSENLADYKKIRKFEIFKGDLPATATRKIKRNELLELIQKPGKTGDK